MEPTYPLHAKVCDFCMLVQLEDVESREAIFEHYAYFSSYSESWLKHAESYAEMMTERFHLGRDSTVVEVASNDGYLLQYFQRSGIRVLGIEPAANVAATAVEKGIPTYVAFFGADTARNLRDTGHAADAMAANNVLAHVPDINDFVSGFSILLKQNGVATFEFPHLLNLIEHSQFDTIYHEHFSYLSLNVVKRILERHGMRVFDVQTTATHGGSLRVFACHAGSALDLRGASVTMVLDAERQAGLEVPETYDRFARKVVEVKCSLLRFLVQARSDGKSVVGYGAPAKGNTLLNYCGVGPELVFFTVDLSPHKQGTLLPGSRIPVLDPRKIMDTRPDYVLILPWNLADEIRRQMAGIQEWGGRFVVPIPEVIVL